jgi:hypothetical protein
VNIYDRTDRHLAAPRHQTDEDTRDFPPAVGRFAATVDAMVDGHLTGDEVETRLERVQRNAERSVLASDEWGLDNPNWHGFATELAEYGYCIVQMWLRVALVWIRANSAIGGQRIDLSEDDIYELTQETVARGIHSLRDEAQRSGQWPSEDTIELRTTFLAQCARQLPHAYHSTVDPLEELAGHPTGVLLGHALRHCVTDWHDHTARLLQSWKYSGQESNEIIGITLEALDLAAHRYPELPGPHTTVRAHSDQAVDR